MATVGNSGNRPELRKSARRPFHYNACILIQEQQQSCLCHIADISGAGARIVLENECGLPERFVLLLSRKGDARRQCRLVWRDGLTIGVAFPAPQQS
jgi:hypothetical protein